VGDRVFAEFTESFEIASHAGTPFQFESYRAGDQTGVFFGSALVNFGLEPLLDGLVQLAPPPGPRESDRGLVDPASPDFSGFVFKIQANMDPRHRDRVAFVRVCSGRLEKDSPLVNARGNQTIRAARVYRMFGRERETVTNAIAGDIVGLVNPGRFAIGDTLYQGQPVKFNAILRFPSEQFARLRLVDSKHKQFDDGVRQLEEEGLIQVLYPRSYGREPLVGVIGPLQFDVIAARLESEYGVKIRVEPMSMHTARWVDAPAGREDALLGLDERVMQTSDKNGRLVLVFPSAWALEYAERQNPGVRFPDTEP